MRGSPRFGGVTCYVLSERPRATPEIALMVSNAVSAEDETQYIAIFPNKYRSFL